MQPIVPIVGISKISASYDAVMLGFDGVLTKGDGLIAEALEALKKLHLAGKEIVLLSNTPLRISSLADILRSGGVDLSIFKAIITSGEVMHYYLKNKTIGHGRYFNIGGGYDDKIFENLPYQKVSDMNEADFIFIANTADNKPSVDDYMPDLQAGLALNLPLLCVGTDVARHKNGEVCLASGAVAEQYATIGGKIVTVGKPDPKIVRYAGEAFSQNVKKILFIGDSLTCDMKSAATVKADMLLISKGIHMCALGEGYIPDVQKTRMLALNYDVYPNFVISGLRY
ncbi:MAG: TIGR01459 family HAD-type hydrolase [Alphaproteobacteria bacterium]|nr:TIGR01459 family HAD-type hydrolase [Alphaproteobacteria bacterium]